MPGTAHVLFQRKSKSSFPAFVIVCREGYLITSHCFSMSNIVINRRRYNCLQIGIYHNTGHYDTTHSHYAENENKKHRKWVNECGRLVNAWRSLHFAFFVILVPNSYAYLDCADQCDSGRWKTNVDLAILSIAYKTTKRAMASVRGAERIGSSRRLRTHSSCIYSLLCWPFCTRHS